MSTARKRLVLTGASGLLGTAILEDWGARWDTVALVGRHRIRRPDVENVACDLERPSTLGALVANARPDVVVHCAAWTNLDACEADPARARTIHRDATEALAAATAKAGAAFVYISTDSLFSGTGRLHAENDPVDPRSVYAKTKYEGERVALAACAATLVVRTCIIGWNAQPKTSLAEWLIRELRSGKTVKAFTDVAFTPILTTTLASALERLVDRGTLGVLNVSGAPGISKHDFAVAVADVFDLPRTLVVPSTIADVALQAFRPPAPCLDSSRYAALTGARLESPIAALREMRRLEEAGWPSRMRATLEG